MLTLELPFPPSVNTYWRHVPMRGGVRSLISARGRKYRQSVAETVMRNRAKSVGSARLAVVIMAYPPDRRKRDIDNLPKAILDALAHAGVYEDDEQIDRLTVWRMGRHKGGMVVVTIMEAT